MKNLTILGAGAWGTALASAFSNNFETIKMWSYLPEEAELLNTQGVTAYLPGVKLTNVKATTSLKEVAEGAEIIMSVVPSFSIRKTWSQIVEYTPPNAAFINASKGIEQNTHALPYEVYNELFKNRENYYSLGGPSFATDVGKGSPTAVNLAGKNKELTETLIKTLQTKTFFLQYSNDIIGTELGAVLKNVIAIASGLVLGMGYGPNTQALVVVEGINEMMQIGKVMGAQKETFLGLAGLGDLLLTAMNSESRNMSFGYNLGKGMDVDNALKELKGVSEGYYTTQSLDYLLKKYSLSLPLFKMITAVLIQKKPAKSELENLFKELY